MNWTSRCGRVEEVEGVARRRRVEDEQVVVAALVDLVELLHRHVLLRAGERARDLPVDPVVEDPLAGLLVGSVALDHLVEGRLRVEHHRPELARRPGRRPPRSKSAGSTCALGVAELVEAERVGEPLGRVDRQHRDPLAARRHPGRDRRRGRRLADAAGADADADRRARRGSPRSIGAHAIAPASALELVRRRCAARTGTGSSRRSARRRPRAQPLELRRAGRPRARLLGAAAAIAAPPAAVACRGGRRSSSCLGGREALGVEAVGVDPVDGERRRLGGRAGPPRARPTR